MSAGYAAALAATDRADKAAGDAMVEDYPAVLAQVATARAILALVDEVEQAVELLRTLVDPGTTDEQRDLDPVHVAGQVLSCTGADDCPGDSTLSVHGRWLHAACSPMRSVPPDPRYPPMRTS